MYYVYLFGVGLLLYLALRAYNSTMPLAHVWCLYGDEIGIWMQGVITACRIQFGGFDADGVDHCIAAVDRR